VKENAVTEMVQLIREWATPAVLIGGLVVVIRSVYKKLDRMQEKKLDKIDCIEKMNTHRSESHE
jgi:hypothetical protein